MSDSKKEQEEKTTTAKKEKQYAEDGFEIPPWYKMNKKLEEVSLLSVLGTFAREIGLGTDITKISIPGIFCYPISLLELIAWKVNRAMPLLSEINKEKDPVVRMMGITKWFFSTLTPDQWCKKPYNPIIGETCETAVGDNILYSSEQVSHHPPISAVHFENFAANAVYHGQVLVEAKYKGNYVATVFIGDARIKLRDWDEEYVFNMPMPIMNVCGILIKAKRVEYDGNVIIKCDKTGLSSHVSFISPSFWSYEVNELSGKIKRDGAKKSENLVSFEGRWDKIVKYTVKDTKNLDVNPESVKMFEKNIMFDYSKIDYREDMRFLTSEKTKDSREVWDVVSNAIREGDLATADAEKQKIEQAQRTMQKQLDEKGDKGIGYKGVNFQLDENNNWVIKQERVDELKPEVIGGSAGKKEEKESTTAADGEEKKKKKKKKKAHHHKATGDAESTEKEQESDSNDTKKDTKTVKEESNEEQKKKRKRKKKKEKKEEVDASTEKNEEKEETKDE